MSIIIDADGCPVVDITISIAKKYDIEVIIVSDTSHMFNYDVKTITVTKGADSADFAIVNTVCEKDIVITQDYGLAAMCLAKKAIPLNQNGFAYTDDNIDSMLFKRHLSKKIRKAGGKTASMKKRKNIDNERFAVCLEKTILNLIKSI